MTYNMTFLDQGSTILDAAVGVNTWLTGGWLASILMLIIWLITFLAFKKGDTGAAFTVSSFITSVAGVFLFASGLLGVEMMLVPILLTLIGVFMHAISDD